MYYNLDWSELPQKYIDEGLNAEFQLIHQPSILYCAPTSFIHSDLYKEISKKYRCGARYFLNPPHTLYDWHTDNKRSCAINWVIKTNDKCTTLYRKSIPEAIPVVNKRSLLYNLTEVLYNGHKPTLLNTKEEHCVINNSDDGRVILSLTIFDTTYDEALEFLKQLDYK